MTAPVFRSFDEAWRWFSEGGALVPIDAGRERLHGRAQQLAFQVAAGGAPVRAAAQRVLDEFADVEALLPTPMDHLHVSVRTAGFQVLRPRLADEITRADVDRIARAAGVALKNARRLPVLLGPVGVFPDALVLAVRDDGGLAELRARLAAATSLDEQLGFDAGMYLPQVTIATFADAGVATVLRERLPALRARPPEAIELRRVEFVRVWFTGLDAGPPEIDTLRSYTLR
jgi:hypothetical protein